MIGLIFRALVREKIIIKPIADNILKVYYPHDTLKIKLI